jgi:hypothetical protein
MKYRKLLFNKIPIIREKSEIVIVKDGKRIYNPSEELLL